MPARLENACFVIEHYHLFDGGIAHVIADMLESVLEFRKSCIPVILYSSGKYQDEDRNGAFKKFTHPSMVSLSDKELDRFRIEQLESTSHRGIIIDSPALAYSSKRYSSPSEFDAAASERCRFKVRLVQKLLTLRSLVLHQIHNPTLMKNPLESFANFLLARSLVDEEYFQLRQICDLTESSAARAPLRNLQATIAGPGTTRRYGINGTGVAWHSGPNIAYVTTNSSDKQMIEECFGELRGNQVAWRPLPVNKSVAEYSDRKVDAFRSARVDEFIEHYASRSGYTFLPDAKLLLAAEVARERKNTVEQVLMLTLFNQCGSRARFQLLVTAFPTSKRDLRRIELIREYVMAKKIPIVMGFGVELTESTNLAIEDLWKHPRAFAALTTSVEEGFGLNFINPSIASLDLEHRLALPTVGRMLPRSYSDFEGLGLAMPRDAFYGGIRVHNQLIRPEFSSCIEDNQIDTHAVVKQLSPIVSEVCSESELADPIELDRDFAEYPVAQQLLLLDLIDYPSLAIQLQPFLDALLNTVALGRAAFDVGARARRILSRSDDVDHLEEMVWGRLRENERTRQHFVMLRDNTALLHRCGTLHHSVRVKAS